MAEKYFAEVPLNSAIWNDVLVPHTQADGDSCQNTGYGFAETVTDFQADGKGCFEQARNN